MESYSNRTAGKTPAQSLASDPHVSADVRKGAVTPSPVLAHPLPQQSPDSKNPEVIDVDLDYCSLPGVARSTISSPLASAAASRATVDLTEMAENEAPLIDLRRSGRERTSTVIQIDGHTVLKQNNYVLKGLGYAYGDNTVVASKNKNKNKKRMPTVVSADAQPRKSPRVQTAAETERQKHNLKIKRRVASKADIRLQHLAKQQDILKPFLDDITRVKLLSCPPGISEPNREMFLQPEAIQADMRDYQLAGLNWMVKMHDKNLGMIL
jgi:hypothetical protein